MTPDFSANLPTVPPTTPTTPTTPTPTPIPIPGNTTEAKLKFPDGSTILISATALHAETATAATGADATEWLRDDLPCHDETFTCVVWGGVLYTFTPAQRPIVAKLWKAWEKGMPFVGAAQLLGTLHNIRDKIRDTFRNSPAWGELIISGIKAGGPNGTYCLKPLQRSE
jgi:hypothetical protein